MKDLSEAISKLQPPEAKELSEKLKAKGTSQKDITTEMLTVTGMHRLLSSLSRDEFRVLQVVYGGGNGKTLGEIEKELKIGVPAIAAISKNLSKHSMVFAIKNRQLLNNKMDKIYAITELTGMINFVGQETIASRIKRLTHLIPERMPGLQTKPAARNKKTDILAQILTSGCILSLSELETHFTREDLDKNLPQMSENGLINLYHCYDPVYACYLTIGEGIDSESLGNAINGHPATGINVHNRFFMLLCLLYAYDTISTYGLFLTKQFEFRKIDKRKIEESMTRIFDSVGSEVSPETTAQLALYVLNRMNCLRLNKDVATISLLKIEKELDQPPRLLVKTLKSLNTQNPDQKHFDPPFAIPSFEMIHSMIKILSKTGPTHQDFLKMMVVTELISFNENKQIEAAINHSRSETSKYREAINLLCMMGIIEIKNGLTVLSDIGLEISSFILRAHYETAEPESKKSIYINPDFTLIIPVNEVSSSDLYNLLTHTDIIKNDFVLHALISKASIVKARKRGMSFKKFLDTLKDHSKNELPQNLSFLLTEWSNQTINMDISYSILLKTSHPAFLDEISYGKMKNSIVERISEHYAIIKKEHIDEIVKAARKKDAVISLFTSFESED
ncbi:MAG: helicase-associated domain-containing protein [Spirochaetes bacterium]|jgi:hypothetical protein|nr:helicase-associated domain-containing protein [Spirochaetota bacterium]